MDKNKPTDWDARYSEAPNLFGDETNQFLISRRALISECQSALFIGDGEGQNGIWAATQGLHVISVDQSAAANINARNKAKEKELSIQFIHADILKWLKTKKRFDLITLFFVHLPPAQRKLLHQQIIDALSNQGILLLECFDVSNLDRGIGPSEASMLYTEEIIEKDFSQLHRISFDIGERQTYEKTRGYARVNTLRYAGRKN